MDKILLTTTKRSAAIDLLRYSAVLVIFFVHYTDVFNLKYLIVPENLKWAPIFRYGQTALYILFMISGYLTTKTSMDRNLKEFTIARASTIYPIFWLSCIAAFLLPRIVGHSYLEYSSLKVLLANLTMIAPIFGAPLINPVFYTLVAQIIFYVFIALIIALRLWKWILPVIGLLLIYCAFCALDRDMGMQNFFPSYAVGMLTYFIRNKIFNKWILYLLLALSMGITLLTGKIIALDMQDLFRDHITFHFEIFCVTVVCIHIIFFMATAKNTGIKNNRLTRALGELSYAFYLFHVYFLVFYWYLSDKIQPDLLLSGLLFVILTVSWVLNVLIQKPFVKFSTYLLTAATNLFGKNDSDNRHN